MMTTGQAPRRHRERDSRRIARDTQVLLTGRQLLRVPRHAFVASLGTRPPAIAARCEKQMAKESLKTASGPPCVALLLVVGATLFTGTAAAGQEPLISFGEPVMTVRVDNVAEIWPANLRLAESRAADAFRQIGVHVLWVHIDADIYPHVATMFTLVLAVEPNRGGEWLHQDVLGFASPQAHRAWVFWDQIDKLKARWPSTAIVLGDVMAHELGHLLLPSRAHSNVGVMRPDVDKGFRSTETFTKRQARQIVIQLQQTSTVAEGNH